MTFELFGIGGLSAPLTYALVAGVAFLLFGNRLPSVMRSLGRSVVEFKKGVAGIEDDLEETVNEAESKAKNKANRSAEEASI